MSDRMVATVLCTWPWRGGEDDSFRCGGLVGWVGFPPELPSRNTVAQRSGSVTSLSGACPTPDWHHPPGIRGSCRKQREPYVGDRNFLPCECEKDRLLSLPSAVTLCSGGPDSHHFRCFLVPILLQHSSSSKNNGPRSWECGVELAE